MKTISISILAMWMVGQSAFADGTGAINDFLTLPMVQNALPFYNRPYPNAPQDYIQRGRVRVYRPNHGLAHGVRKAALSEDLLGLLVANPANGEMRSWLMGKVAADHTFHQKLNLIALMSRTGREDEADGGPPEVRRRQMQAGADSFKMLAASVDIHFAPGELENLAQAIVLDGASSGNSDRSHMSRFLRVAHTVELRRLGWNLDVNIRSLIPEITTANLMALHGREDVYLDATGLAGGNYEPIFFKLSLDPAALLRTMLAVRNGE